MGFTEAYFDYLAVKLSKIAALNKLKEVAGHPLGCSVQLIILWRSKWSWVRTRRYQLNQFTIYVCVNLFNIYIAHVLIYAHMLSQFSLERIDDFSSLDKKYGWVSLVDIGAAWEQFHFVSSVHKHWEKDQCFVGVEVLASLLTILIVQPFSTWFTTGPLYNNRYPGLSLMNLMDIPVLYQTSR